MIRGFNVVRKTENLAPITDMPLGQLAEEVYAFRTKDGVELGGSVLRVLHRDPRLRAIVLDLQFPANPFAP